MEEIQPQPVAVAHDDVAIRSGIVAGQVVLALAAVLFLVAIMSLSPLAGASVAQTLLAAAVLASLGALLAQTAHRYVGEIEFESDLISFKVTGTYSESRIATGMSIYDSTRSENVIVRSSLTPWLLVSRIRTSTLAGIGASSLAQPRLVLALDQNDLLRDQLVQETRGFLRDRQLMATVDSDADLRAAGQIYSMNEATRSRPETPGNVPQIPQDRRDDKLIR